MVYFLILICRPILELSSKAKSFQSRNIRGKSKNKAFIAVMQIHLICWEDELLRLFL